MPVPMEVRKKIEEDLRLIEPGKESYGSLAERYGVSKSTIFRIHIKKLRRLAEKAKEELKALKHEKKKLQTDFEGLEQKYQKKNQALQRTHKQTKEKLEQEVNRLEQQKIKIKSVLETQGLTWEDAGEILKHILDLRGEKARLQTTISELETEVSNWETKAGQARCRFLQLDERLSNLREVVKTEETEFHCLLDEIMSARRDLYTMNHEKRKLEETVKTFKETISVHKLQERKNSLQAEVEKLTAQLEELRPNVETLTEEVKRLEAERKRLRLDRDKLRSEREEKIKKAKELADRIVTDAEQEKQRLLAEAEEEKREILGEIEKLQAEETFLKTAIRMRLKEFREARQKLEEEEAGRVVDEDLGPVGNLLSHIPKLPPLKSAKRDKGER